MILSPGGFGRVWGGSKMGIRPDAIGTPETGHGIGWTPLFSGVDFRPSLQHRAHRHPVPTVYTWRPGRFVFKTVPETKSRFSLFPLRNTPRIVGRSRGTQSFQKPSRRTEMYAASHCLIAEVFSFVSRLWFSFRAAKYSPETARFSRCRGPEPLENVRAYYPAINQSTRFQT